jgi:hypothetical protein
VKRPALLGLEQTLGEVDLGRFAKIAERKAHLGLDVVGVRLLPNEREGTRALWLA